MSVLNITCCHWESWSLLETKFSMQFYPNPMQNILPYKNINIFSDLKVDIYEYIYYIGCEWISWIPKICESFPTNLTYFEYIGGVNRWFLFMVIFFFFFLMVPISMHTKLDHVPPLKIIPFPENGVSICSTVTFQIFLCSIIVPKSVCYWNKKMVSIFFIYYM